MLELASIMVVSDVMESEDADKMLQGLLDRELQEVAVQRVEEPSICRCATRNRHVFRP
jgi:hypothetical protein